MFISLFFEIVLNVMRCEKPHTKSEKVFMASPRRENISSILKKKIVSKAQFYAEM